MNQDFINEIAPVVVPLCKKYGLKPSVCIAQAILESDWGRKRIGGFNIFGRKYAGYGTFVEVTTREFINGKWVTVKDKFRSYETLEAAVESYCILISNPPYQNVKKQQTLEAYVRELGKVYATDPRYAEKLLSLIKTHKLDQFDV